MTQRTATSLLDRLLSVSTTTTTTTTTSANAAAALATTASPPSNRSSTTSNSLPDNIIRWILCVTNRTPITVHAIQQVQLNGLSKFKIFELKLLWDRLKHLPSVHRKQRMLGKPSGLRKREQASLLECYFYQINNNHTNNNHHDGAASSSSPLQQRLVSSTTIDEAVQADIVRDYVSKNYQRHEEGGSYGASGSASATATAAAAAAAASPSFNYYSPNMTQAEHAHARALMNLYPNNMSAGGAQQLQQSLSTSSSSPATAAAATTAAGRTASSSSSSSLPWQQQQFSSAYRLVRGPNGVMQYQQQQQQTPQQQTPQQQQQQQNSRKRQYHQMMSPSEALSPALSDDTSGAVADGESNSPQQQPSQPCDQDPSVTPAPGTVEVGLFRALQDMGFTDEREMLVSIRACLAANHNALHATTTPEQCMLECVRRREEMDEAKKMDQARLESERTRKQEAAERRAQNEADRQAQMMTASLDTLHTDFFPNSWLLLERQEERHQHKVGLRQLWAQILSGKDNASRNAFKAKLIELLEFEKKAHKWYKAELPSAWFVHVCGKRLAGTPATTVAMTAALQKECDALEKGLYSRSEQTTGEAGVPKMFLEALGKYGDCNGGASSSNGGSLRIERTVATDGSSAKEVICIDDE